MEKRFGLAYYVMPSTQPKANLCGNLPACSSQLMMSAHLVLARRPERVLLRQEDANLRRR